MSAYAGIILAGGDGTRLSALTPWEEDAARAVYGRLASVDLSRQVAAKVNRVEVPTEVRRRLRDFLSGPDGSIS